MVAYNLPLINSNDLSRSFFCLSKGDPTIGFEYDASDVFGPTWPPDSMPTNQPSDQERAMRSRLVLGSHLARHLRHELEFRQGYTSTVGIATNKVLSKLVGNVNKPKNQTTIIPYETTGASESTVTRFLDTLDIGKIPGIGFKLAQKIRAHVLGRSATFSEGLVYGGTKEDVSVLDVRTHPGMGPEQLEEILSGSNSPKGIGGKIWDLIHGIDDTEVGKAKRVPSQISQEDSYMKYLHTLEQVRTQLYLLAERLIRRMQVDLVEEDGEDKDETNEPRRRWMAHPRTLRLSTRPRPAPGPDGVRARTFQRLSRSTPMPNFVFSLSQPCSALAERLVEEALVPMFRKLHHEKAGWNLSLINVAATNMAEAAAESKDSEGRDIGRMFRLQHETLKDFQILEDHDHTEDDHGSDATTQDAQPEPQDDLQVVDGWDSSDSDSQLLERCEFCHNTLPVFALEAHRRYHEVDS